MEEERGKLLRFSYVHFKRGEFTTAASYCERLLSKFPDDAEAIELMGDIHMELAKWQEASHCYERALQLAPSRIWIVKKLEKVRRNLGEAEKLLKRASGTGDISAIGKRRTSLGLAENIEGFLCYLLPAIFPLLVLLLERESKFARFHAIQSLLFSAIGYILSGPISLLRSLFQSFGGTLPLLHIVMTVLGGIIFFIWCWLAIGALRGEKNKLPWLGKLAEHWASL